MSGMHRSHGRLLRAALVCGAVVVGAVVVTGPASAAKLGVATPGVECTPFAKQPCLLPYPNNLFTKPDKKSDTGVRVDMPQGAMPTGSGGPISVAPYDRADGFDPGSAIIAKVPGLDNPQAFAKTNPVQLSNLARYKRKNAPIVVIDADTGKRALIWSELDSTASDPASTTLLIHPGKLLTEGDRYIVAMRNLKNSSGKTLKAPRWFALLRDGKKLPKAERSQAGRYKSIFKTLKTAKIGRKSLYEAWDFTVESEKSLTGPMVAIRNDAFKKLGDSNLADGKVKGHAPPFTVSSVTPNPYPGIQKEIVGSYQVPCYLTTTNCAQGGAFNYSSNKPDAVPVQKPGNFATAAFDCIVPSTASASAPARASLYGHGLFGDMGEAHAGNVRAMASEHNFMFCATEWWGLAGDDSGLPGTENDPLYDIGVLQDLTKFPPHADERRLRVQRRVPKRVRPVAV